MYTTLAILGGFLWFYSVVAPRVERTLISGPILFVAFGLIMGPGVLNLLPLKTDVEVLSTLAELTLALVLLTDAAGADLTVLSRTKELPIRLLAIGLPLTIGLGFLAGWAIYPGLPLLEVALLAAILAPTDAALGKAVVTNDAVPSSMRQGLNVESGLNDGICVPVVILFLTLISGEDHNNTPVATGLALFAQAVGIGLAVGTVFSTLAVWLLHFSKHHHWMSPVWSKVHLLALAFTCFGTAQALGGSGFIACFVAGLIFGHLYRPHHSALLDAAEGIGDAFALLTWVLFGAIAVDAIFAGFSWQAFLYAILSLTLIRMLPVFLALTRLVKDTQSKLFIGWFGPRGLASIVFIVMAIDEKVPNADVLQQAVVYTVVLSILLHGITANPWANAIGKRSGATQG